MLNRQVLKRKKLYYLINIELSFKITSKHIIETLRNYNLNYFQPIGSKSKQILYLVPPKFNPTNYYEKH